ncbi:MAG: CooT family nickel-binding protein [Actinomycetota bacterium]|jgi:predicted RNA-binding protein|nr:CooT family nickel-binding protein [Actinomycetota bacterium]MDA8166821.1 CooT family nickel-binding protein [Actinomycetota bacterium]
MNAYLVTDGHEKEVMQDVAVISVEGGNITLTDILGQQKTLKARIRELKLLEHKIYLD